MSEAQRDIAARMGSAFASIVDRFLPAIAEAVSRTEKEISLGATVKFRLDKKTGTVVGKLIPHEPKIPTEEIKPICFLLSRDAAGQLSFLFDGTLQDLKAEKPES